MTNILKSIFWCKTCLNMSTRPRIYFNKNGICNACVWSEEKKNINWNLKKKELLEVLKKYKKKIIQTLIASFLLAAEKTEVM